MSTETHSGNGSSLYTAPLSDPETPFMDLDPLTAESPSLIVSEGPLETPFTSEFLAGEGIVENPETVDFKELLFSLYDTEFDEALAELVDEATFAHPDGVIGETAAVDTLAREAFLQEWIDPLREAAETMFERMGSAAGEQDVTAMSERELDAFFSQFEPGETSLAPVMEDFLGKLWKKAKSVVKGAVKLAKKGIAAVGKILPIGAILSKLKALVRPLLRRVLRMALDRLPAPLRPLARKLARRLLGETGSAEVDELERSDGQIPGPDASVLQHEFDAALVGLTFAADEMQQEIVVAEMLSDSEADVQSEAVDALDDARRRFAAEVEQLDPGVTPEMLMENFIPAILPALRIGIGVIGRPKVVRFLAGLLGNLIKPYIGPQLTPVLSRAIVDTGLRLMTLEAPSEGEEHLAGQAVAATVEDTIRGLAEHSLETFADPRLMEAATYESFVEAAAANFPPSLIRPEFREAGRADGTWIARPTGHRPYYRKYTRVFDITLTPQTAKQIASFGGRRLEDVLRDRLGVTLPAKARVHLYQATSRTTPGRIAKLDSVPGMAGGAGAGAQFHPLTPKAAGLLLGEPGLGRRTTGRYRATPMRLSVGQRLYFLHIDGARVRVVPSRNGRATQPARSGETSLVMDFPRNELRAVLYVSERQAQEIAARIRRREPIAGILATLQSAYGSVVRAAMSGDLERHVKIIHEHLEGEEFLGSALNKVASGLRDQFGRQVVGWIGSALSRALGGGAAPFLAAVEEPADGVTIVVRIVNPPGLPAVRAALSRGPAVRATGRVADGNPPRVDVGFKAGLVRD